MDGFVSEEDIENVVALIDQYALKGDGRIKIQVSEEVAPGTSKRQYHHGRCDVGSPWAKGQAFDVLEDEVKIEDVTPPKRNK